VLGRVEPEGPLQEQQRQRLLRTTTELRGQLAAAKQRFGQVEMCSGGGITQEPGQGSAASHAT